MQNVTSYFFFGEKQIKPKVLIFMISSYITNYQTHLYIWYTIFLEYFKIQYQAQ